MKNWWTKHVSADTVILYLFGLLIAGLFLLWAVVGWANDIYSNCFKNSHNGDIQCTIVIEPDRPTCEEKMEAAMREMEFWSVLNFEDTEQVDLKIVKPFAFEGFVNYWAELPAEDPAIFTPRGLMRSLNTRAGHTIVLWETVKRECWRQP